MKCFDDLIFGKSGKFYQSCSGYFDGNCEFSGNGNSGMKLEGFSRAYFIDGYTGQIANNGKYGLYISLDAHTQNHTKNTFSNNGTGVVDDVYTDRGGSTW